MVIRQLSSIKAFLSSTNLNTLICTKIFLQLDYCNSLYYGISTSSIKKLQRVQNAAARLIRTKAFSTSLDDVFLKYHWLKINERIKFKLLLTVHKCLVGKAPQSVLPSLVTGAERTVQESCWRVKWIPDMSKERSPMLDLKCGMPSLPKSEMKRTQSNSRNSWNHSSSSTDTALHKTSTSNSSRNIIN